MPQFPFLTPPVTPPAVDRSLCGLLGLPAVTDEATLEALELQTTIMARVPVAIDLGRWRHFLALERLVVADAYERHQIDLGMLQGSAARSVEGAATAYAGVDGGKALVRLRLQDMAREALR